jgi:hypothetical protein
MNGHSVSKRISLFFTLATLMIVAQAEIRVPSDAELELMEQRAITTPPLDIDGAPRTRGGEEAEIRRMDERARRIDERLMNDGAICSDCK